MTKEEAAIRLADAAVAYREAEINEYADDILADRRQDFEAMVAEYRNYPACELLGTWCPQCGYGVKVDEDGCCASCGADATGNGADEAIKLKRQATAPKERREVVVEGTVEDFNEDTEGGFVGIVIRKGALEPGQHVRIEVIDDLCDGHPMPGGPF